MSRVQFGVVVALLMVVAAASAAPMLFRASVRPSFEYRVEDIRDQAFEAKMDVLGNDGWELVFARRASGPNDEMAYEVIFKRSK